MQAEILIPLPDRDLPAEAPAGMGREIHDRKIRKMRTVFRKN